MADFTKYIEKIRASERLKLTLKLFKSGKITMEEAVDLIATDVQFHEKEEVSTWNIPLLDHNSTFVGGLPNVITTPGTTNPYIINSSGTVTYTSGLSDNSTS